MEAIFSAIGLSLTALTGVFYVVIRLSKVEVRTENNGNRIDQMERTHQDQYEKLDKKLDTIITQLIDVKIDLNNKMDRQK